MDLDPSSCPAEGEHRVVLAEVDVDGDVHDLVVLVMPPLPL